MPRKVRRGCKVRATYKKGPTYIVLDIAYGKCTVIDEATGELDTGSKSSFKVIERIDIAELLTHRYPRVREVGIWCQKENHRWARLDEQKALRLKAASSDIVQKTS